MQTSPSAYLSRADVEAAKSRMGGAVVGIHRHVGLVASHRDEGSIYRG